MKRDIAILGSIMKVNNFTQRAVKSKKIYNRQKFKAENEVLAYNTSKNFKIQ